jgi:DNA/RNA-binding domain of Phe-tRNA-synthetase-like protein
MEFIHSELANEAKMPDWNIAANTPAQLGIALIENVSVTPETRAFERLIACARKYQQEFSGKSPGEIEQVQTARRLFRAIGIDPTRRRPSSEALLNRALKNKGLSGVNNLVDVGNWCSLEFLLPLCIYDATKIAGPVTVRQGQNDDEYEALNQRRVNLHGRYLLADQHGAFGSPMTDSLRTAVDWATGSAILGIWAPLDFHATQLEKHLTVFCERVLEYCGGSRVWQKLFSGAA